MQREVVRPIPAFRTRVLTAFRSPPNEKRLRAWLSTNLKGSPTARKLILSTLTQEIYQFSNSTDVLDDDPLAKRGSVARSSSVKTELERLNRAFLVGRLKFADGLHIDMKDNMSYQYAMFKADSMTYSHLNGPGPHHELLEDQKIDYSFTKEIPAVREGFMPHANAAKTDGTSISTVGAAKSSSSLLSRILGKLGVSRGVSRGAPRRAPHAAAAAVYAPPPPKPEKKKAASKGGAQPPPDEDDAWDDGDAGRSPELAMAQYWGESKVPSSAVAGKPPVGDGHAYGDATSWGNAWIANNGRRFMRKPTIPFWQKEGAKMMFDRDIEENLGTGMRETGGISYRVDMSRLTLANGKGMQTRRYGPVT